MTIIKQYFSFIGSHLSGRLFCLDIGAYKGAFGELVRSIYPGSEVIMFEPSPEAYKNLLENFPKQTIHNYGISEKNYSENFVIYKDCPSLNRVTDLKQSTEKDEVIEIDLKNIDSLYSDKEIDICKIDTEGLEFKVLKGAENLLIEKKIKFIFFECGSTFLAKGYELKEVLKYLAGVGYNTYAIRDGKLTKLETSYNEHHVDDYMATYLEI